MRGSEHDGAPWREGRFEGSEVDEADELKYPMASRVPWDGQSPRGLTRAFSSFTFHAGTGRVNRIARRLVAGDQRELFPEGTSYGT